MKERQHPQPSVGIGLRSKYFEYFLADIPQIPIGWLEVHPENYLYHYPNRKVLWKIAEKFPISFHCVSLSLGSSELPSKEHLENLKQLMNEVNPFMVSDHLSWNILDGFGYNDLYPLPLTHNSLNQITQNVNRMQNFFDRQLLIENPSTYLKFQTDEYSENEFLNLLVKSTGCGILLDVNNLYIQSVNHGWNILEYLNNLSWQAVKEVHLAGHIVSETGDFLVDTHNQPVCQDVWDVYRLAINKKNDVLTLIEWDDNLPKIDELFVEAKRALLYSEQLECHAL